MTARGVAAVLIALGVALGGCRSSEPSTTSSSGRVRFGPRALTVEIADEKGEWGTGLMFRRSMPANAGMLFEFPVRLPEGHGFIMENVRIPLSVAFLQRLNQSEYRVVAIKEMLPCPPGAKTGTTPDCPEYEPGVPYDAAVEANRRWFPRAGIEVGDRATVERNTH